MILLLIVTLIHSLFNTCLYLVNIWNSFIMLTIKVVTFYYFIYFSIIIPFKHLGKCFSLVCMHYFSSFIANIGYKLNFFYSVYKFLCLLIFILIVEMFWKRSLFWCFRCLFLLNYNDIDQSTCRNYLCNWNMDPITSVHSGWTRDRD